jgi:hypothetical protein
MIRAVMMSFVILGVGLTQVPCLAKGRDNTPGKVSVKAINKNVGKSFAYLMENEKKVLKSSSKDAQGIDLLNHEFFDSIEVNRHSVYLTVRF